MMRSGIDVSHWQATTPSLVGLSFAFAKASEGLAPDAKYAYHTANFRRAGIVTGAYHFNRSDASTPEEQARYFVKTAGTVDLLALDVENTRKKAADGTWVLVRRFTVAETKRFIAEVHLLGKKIGLYMSRSGFYTNAGQDWNWVADYRVGSVPNIPWAFWQYTSSDGKLDKDYFNGTLTDLLRLAGKEPPTLTTAEWAAAVAKARTYVGTYLAVPVLNDKQRAALSADLKTLDANLAGLVASLGTAPAPPVPTPAPPSPPPVPTPPTLIQPISTTPTHIAAQQMSPFSTVFWTADWAPDNSAWITKGGAGTPVCLLVHGGPIANDNLGGVDILAAGLAIAGAKAIAVRYPTTDTTFAQAMEPLRAAVAVHRPTVIVAHSLGGYFGGILAAETGLPLVMVATDDQPNDAYRLALGGPVARQALLASKVRVTVITGSSDLVATVAEHQALVADLHAAGHPGRWVVIDGANHDSILSDIGASAAILA